MATQPTVNGLVNGMEPHTNGVREGGDESLPLVRNDPSQPWVVQKFGGTSVGKEPRVIAEQIVRQWLQSNQVAVVCSARSSTRKEDGTTNRLLGAARAVEEGRPHEPVVAGIRSDHLSQADSLLRDPHIRAEVRADVARQCDDLAALLAAAAALGEVSAGTRDRVASAGERLACVLMAGLLRDGGVDAVYVDLSDAIRAPAAAAAAAAAPLPAREPELNEAFYTKLGADITARVRRVAGGGTSDDGRGTRVPVVTGYFGRVAGGLLRRVGRGYTDLCAALLAVGLGARELQIWKEVDGIFTANPAKVPTAALLPRLSPEEAAELTFYGSEVIHPFTMEQAVRARIPIRIRNVMRLRNPGTLIAAEPEAELPAAGAASVPATPPATADPPEGVFAATSPKHRRSRAPSLLNGAALNGPGMGGGSGRGARRRHPKRPTAVTVKPHILVLNIHSNKRSLSHGFYARIFGALDRFRLSVDLISTSEVHVSMALHSETALSAPPARSGCDDDDEGAAAAPQRVVDADVAGAVEELRQYGSVDVLGGMAILCLVGKQMQNMVGVAGRMFSVLGENGVNIEMISQGELPNLPFYVFYSTLVASAANVGSGSSEINISCVIEERDADRALSLVHTHLFSYLD